MKIERIRCRLLAGTLEHEEALWEERVCRPVDVYPRRRAEGHGLHRRGAGGGYPLEAAFVEVETDGGVQGLAGPITLDVARLVLSELAGLLVGEDPEATELVWDTMYRWAVHGRKGPTMMAISAVDCALWDIRGKRAGLPIYRLLGGPTREAIPTYASMLGFSVEPAAAARRARQALAQGYRAQKWFFRAGSMQGSEGLRQNEALAIAVREAVGVDTDLMFDCWMSWDLPYARQMAPRLAPVAPRWLEEPVLPDQPELCAAIRRVVPFPLANGEHEHTRWGFRHLLELEAQDVLQPDIFWAGGISEVLKICALASAHGVAVIPHGHSTHATAHVTAALPPALCPVQEFLVKWNVVHQFFLAQRLAPVQGSLALPDRPGLGLEIDDSRVERAVLLEP